MKNTLLLFLLFLCTKILANPDSLQATIDRDSAVAFLMKGDLENFRFHKLKVIEYYKSQGDYSEWLSCHRQFAAVYFDSKNYEACLKELDEVLSDK